MSASEYTALARLILAFCPPLMLMPLSPILVPSPSLRSSISSCRHHKLMTLSSLSLSYSFPNNILFWTVSDVMNGSCSTYHKLPVTNISPCLISSSFMIVFNSVVFPHPTGPTTAMKSCLLASNVISIRLLVGSSVTTSVSPE